MLYAPGPGDFVLAWDYDRPSLPNPKLGPSRVDFIAYYPGPGRYWLKC